MKGYAFNFVVIITQLVIDVKIFVIFTALVTPNFGALIFCTVAEL